VDGEDGAAAELLPRPVHETLGFVGASSDAIFLVSRS
jgi:hypothetical protein